MQSLSSTGWGGIARVTTKDLWRDPAGWRAALYDRKMLVFRGLEKLSELEFWELHTIWGKPWMDYDYKTTTEKYQPIGDDGNKFLTMYGNKITMQAIGNRQMPWHRDIPWHREKRYPIRTLYPIKMTLGAGETGTRFCDCDVLLNRLSVADQDKLLNTEIQIHSWYQMQFKMPNPERKWIPLVERHPETNRTSVLLNSFGPYREDLPFSTAITGTWILNVRVNGVELENGGLDWINYLHEVACTTDNIYNHTWEEGDLVLFDNYSGIFHGRDRVVAQPDAERLFWRMNLYHNWQK